MHYTSLSEEERKQILDDHIKQAEADHFIHSLNKAKLEATLEAENDKGVKETIQSQIAQLTVYIDHAERAKTVAEGFNEY